MKCLIFSILLIQWSSLMKLVTSRAPMVPQEWVEENKTHEIMRYAKAAGIRSSMNETINPCQDFYKYSCGNWARLNPATRTTKNGIFNTLGAAYDRKVLKWLNKPKVSSESDMERKVKYFYESCINLNAKSYNNREKLLTIMEEFGGMPALKGDKWKSDEFDWMNVVAEILRKYGKQIIIGVDVSTDLSNNEVNRLYIGQPDHMVTARTEDYYGTLQIQYHIELINVLGMDIGPAAKLSYDMVKFAQELAKGVSDPLDGITFQDKCKKRTLDEMSKAYQPTLNYTRFISNWLGYNYNLPVYEYVESYHQNLKNVMENTTESTVANYIMWNLIQDFRMEAEETMEKQKIKCIETTKRFFVKYLDNVVYRQLLSKNRNVVEDMLQIYREMKEVFEDILLSKSSLWMTPETRDKALEKLSGMTIEVNSYETEDFGKENSEIEIGTGTFFDNVISILENRGRKYREKVLSSPKLDSEQIMNLTPGYAPDFNRILMPVAFLQPYFLWDPAYPVALKYATAGYMIAHEMVHAFDDNAREYDAKGNLNNWWDQKSTEQYLIRKECLSQHYSEYKFAGRKMPRSNAQDENIADNMGIRIAFYTYERWLSKQQNNTMLMKNEILPSLQLTPRQLFFVGVAQVWCVDIHSLIRSYLAKIDVHPPEEIRVVAMMSNFDSFSREFQCTSFDPMNPQRKCVMF